MPGIGSIRGNINVILNGMVRDGFITSFETNIDHPISTAFGLHVRVAADYLGADLHKAGYDEGRRELQGRIIRELEPLVPGVIVSVRGAAPTRNPCTWRATGSGFDGKRCRAARHLLGWSRRKAASVIGVSIEVIGAFERGERAPRAETLDAILGQLEAAGVEFTDGDVHVGPKR